MAKVDDRDATKRLMAAITFKEIDKVTQKDAVEMYGFSSSWSSNLCYHRFALIDENGGYFLTPLKNNANPVITEELREWRQCGHVTSSGHR